MATKVKTGVIDSGAITSALITDASITADDLNATLDLTGKTVTVSTASASDNDTTVASTAFVQQEIAALVDSSPSTLNTLNELASALGDDANFSTTVTNSIATKLPLAGGALTGNLSIGDSSSRSFALYIENAGSVGAGQLMLVDSDNDTLQREIRTDAGVLSFDYWDSSNRSNHLTILANSNVGIGDTNPSFKLDVNNTSSRVRFKASSGDSTLEMSAIAGRDYAIQSLSDGRFRIYDEDANADRLIIDGDGNVGIGTTPYANSLSAGIDSVNGLGLFGYNDGFYVSGNAYYNGEWKYKTSGSASKINSNSTGDVIISGAVSGSTDGTITWADNVTIKNSGNVGIGTSSPQAKLHVWNSDGGNATDKASMLSEAVMKLQPHITNSTNMLFAQVDGGNSVGIQVTNGSATANWDLSLSPFGGQVGIGLVDPTAMLHIKHDTDISMSASADGQLKIEGNGYTGAVALNTDGMHIYQNSSARSIIFGNNETEQVRIKHNGYVGIGTDNPLDLLHLNTTSGDVRQLMNAPTGSDAEIKFSEGGNVQYTIGHDAGSSEFRIGGVNVDSDVFLRAKSAGAGTNISIGRGGEEDGLAGLQVMRGGVLINGGYGDMGAIDTHYSNVWTWVGCSGLGGTFNGSVRVNVPNPTGGASGYGYGGFSMEVYVAGYNGKYCHAFLSGYTNNSITLSENAIRASSGGWSTSYGTITSQGFYFDIDYPSGLIHPSIYIRVSKGGHTAGGRGTDFNDINVAWS